MSLRLVLSLFTLSWICMPAVEPVPTEVSPHRIEGAKPRNVVFILSDDHRYDAMSFLGHQFANGLHNGLRRPFRISLRG